MSKLIPIVGIIFLLSMGGCKESPGPVNFTYTYSMESLHNFKVEFRINPDSTWDIARYNNFFDRRGDDSTALLVRGKLTSDEFDKFRKLIRDSDFHHMDDSYGFEGEESIGNDIIYMLSLTQDEESKFVSIREDAGYQFTKEFRALIKFTGDYLNEKLAAE